MRENHLLIGNWKMNLGPSDGAAFARELRENLSPPSRTDVWVAPPTISLPSVAAALSGSCIPVGAQNVHWATSGAFTGETSPLFLKDLGATFAVLGHSERRTLFGETSALVAERTKSALAAGLTAVVCIGETEAERTSGLTERVVAEQLAPVLDVLTAETASRVVLAYEPVWAIGTGKVATLKEIQDAHKFIQGEWNSRALGSSAVILYGGSVNPGNFAEILKLAEVDGALVGGASIKLDQWLALVEIAERTPTSA
jgi:triosephosphate isomerase